MAHHHPILTFEGTCAEDMDALRVYLHQFFIFRHNAADRVRERPGPAPFSLRIAAVQDALQDVANAGIGFVPYAVARGLRVVTSLHYIESNSGYLCTVTVGPGDTLSMLLLAKDETLGHPPGVDDDVPSPPATAGTRRVDLYTVLRVRTGAQREAFFREKLRYYVDLELVQFVSVGTGLVVVAAREAFSDVLAAGRDYGRLQILDVPMVCIISFSTDELREVPLTNLVTVWSLQREGYSVGHFRHTQELPDPPPTKPKKAQSPFPVWTEAEREAALRKAAIPESERTVLRLPPTDAERARAAVTRGGGDSAGKEDKEFEAAWEASVVAPDAPPKAEAEVTTKQGRKMVNVPLEDMQFGEFQLRTIHKDSLTEILGWKPWKERDDVVYNGRCQCKLYEATILAQPCEHLCLCRACYSTYQKHPILAERCPRCNAPVKTYEELYAPDDFMVVDPGQGDDANEKGDKVEADEEGFEDFGEDSECI
jgi:hypothetical protein